jgi:hypothetical protein
VVSASPPVRGTRRPRTIPRAPLRPAGRTLQFLHDGPPRARVA